MNLPLTAIRISRHHPLATWAGHALRHVAGRATLYGSSRAWVAIYSGHGLSQRSRGASGLQRLSWLLILLCFSDFLATRRADSGHASLANQVGDRFGRSTTWRQVDVACSVRCYRLQSGAGYLVAFLPPSALLARSPVTDTWCTPRKRVSPASGESDQARRHSSQVPPSQHTAMGTSAATSGS